MPGALGIGAPPPCGITDWALSACEKAWRFALIRPPQRPAIMGILNLTPDSFSDGGLHDDPAAALTRARRLITQGADILDLGGESTRPGAEPVPAEAEIARVVPVIAALARDGAPPLSVDTMKPAVARAAVGAGAVIWNDVTALRFAPLEEHPNLAVQKSLASLVLRATEREEPVGVIWDYCGGFVFTAPGQYYWAAEPSIGRAVERDTGWQSRGAGSGGTNPFGRSWTEALDAQQVRFIVGRASDLFTGLPAETQAYVRQHYRNNGCLWKRVTE